jgi:hypothetical protein
MATTTGTAFDSLSSYTPSNTAQSGLTGQAAQQNVAAAGDINSLTNLLSNINQNNYLSAPGRQQQLDTIENELSGNLDPSTIYQNQLNNAEQYGAGGFSSDSPAWQTAVQRGLGIDQQNLITAGQTAMNSLYSQMPQVNAQDQTTTPALLEQQQSTQAAQALQQQQIQNQVAQFAQQQAQQLGEFGTTSGQNAASLYAQTYHTLPGYNQYGAFTGQTGAAPTTGTSGATNPNWNSTYHSGLSPGSF